LFAGGFICMLVDGFWSFPFRLPCSGLLFWFFLATMQSYRNHIEPGHATLENDKVLPGASIHRRTMGGMIPAMAALILLLAIEGIVVARMCSVYYKRNAALLSSDIEQYRTILEKSIRWDTLYGHPRILLSDVLTLKGEYHEARNELFEAERLINIAGAGYRKLGFLHLKIKDPGYLKDARESLEKAIVIIPDDPETLEYLGYIEFESNNTDRALAYLQMATRGDPLRPNAYFLIGSITEKTTKDIARAIDYYDRALKSSLDYKAGLLFDRAALIDHFISLTDKKQVK